MAIVASILFLGLLMTKVVLAISTVLVFVGMPIAIVLWPVMPWVVRVLGRTFGVCLAVPLVWSMCFTVSGAMLNDGLLLKGASGFFDALLEPLAAIALLSIMLVLPTKLAQLAMLGAGSPWGWVRFPRGEPRGRHAGAGREPAALAGMGGGTSLRRRSAVQRGGLAARGAAAG